MAEPEYITLERAQRRARQLLVFLEAAEDEGEEKLTPYQVASILRTIDDLLDYNWLYWMCKNIIGETDCEVVDRLQESEDLVKAEIDASV